MGTSYSKTIVAKREENGLYFLCNTSSGNRKAVAINFKVFRIYPVLKDSHPVQLVIPSGIQ